jgi:hypothetical protein
MQELLMNYVMHDFDTGYIQGMTDLAAPILYVFDGDVVKSFWCFVQVLEFTVSFFLSFLFFLHDLSQNDLFIDPTNLSWREQKKNFTISKETIFYQLKMLFKLIQLTDPLFAQYLAENNSANCHFAFRWLICLFKREFVKENAEDYSKCLIVWEAIWSINTLQKMNDAEQKEAEVQRQADAQNKSNSSTSNSLDGSGAIAVDALDDHGHNLSVHDSSADDLNAFPCAQSPICTINLEEIEEVRQFEANALHNSNHHHHESIRKGDRCKAKSQGGHYEQFETLVESDPNPRLDDVELFSLCICLSLIRRERDIIMSNKIEDCGILEVRFE